MIIEAAEWTISGTGYLGLGTWFARGQSVQCWKVARKRYTQTRTQEQGWRELIAVRVLLWPLYGTGRVITKICEKPIIENQQQLAEAKASLEEWTDAEKYAVDDVSEGIARLEAARHRKRILELEA